VTATTNPDAAPLGGCYWTPTAQPRGVIGKQMYEYQLSALTWMLHIEEHAARGFRFAIDFPDRTRLHELEIDESHFVDHFSSRGAILGDEMGLGMSTTTTTTPPLVAACITPFVLTHTCWRAQQQAKPWR
jgi:hypothetical protein